MVAPCPMEYDTAGPTMFAREATKLKTAPVIQTTPPAIPQRWKGARAVQYPLSDTAPSPDRGRRMSK